MTDLATLLIVEIPYKSNPDLYRERTIGLGAGLTLAEIWDRFAKPGRRQPICTMSGGTARVTF